MVIILGLDHLLWIFPNNPWKLHFRMNTNRWRNDGVDFYVTKQFRNYNKPLNIRIKYSKVGNNSNLTFFVNDIEVISKKIGLFKPILNQEFDLKKSWGYYPLKGYTVSNFYLNSNETSFFIQGYRKPKTSAINSLPTFTIKSDNYIQSDTTPKNSLNSDDCKKYAGNTPEKNGIQSIHGIQNQVVV